VADASVDEGQVQGWTVRLEENMCVWFLDAKAYHILAQKMER
jgi:hypothetical protein